MENFNADALLANYKCISKLKLLNSHLTKVNGEDTATAHKKETIDKKLIVSVSDHMKVILPLLDRTLFFENSD